ncbi:TetR/AcrR family transcriptional regulator [Nonomuraea rhodomycinica]|uniref:TetR/AcrR family transcriptional regulator n=1 Tax=Nonomuraea rhodomycinica TaxID=1712872 RepID=A0A7Y6IYT7_9ACTN|nr:TetR/AcrR family transcriptional regulator [Nonomuraea rhodomycinica]NUW46949.1 TetR/AcrR family transcriptional regulator [Nonomuraea rhodomycinica]
MSQLIEHQSRKAARILDSARRLVLDHGVRKVTVSEIAHAAGVGKGTVYLYWAAKEDLILGLFARELLTFLDEIIARIGADPATVLPRRLAPMLVSTGLRLPLASRLKYGDTDLMRVLTQQAADLDLFARVRPSALCDAVMPILRRNGLIRHDRPLSEQSYAMHAVLTGFGTAMSDPATAPLGVDDPGAVLADTVARLLEPAVAPGEEAVAAAAGATVAVFGESRDAVLGLIERSQVTGP